MFTEGYQAWEDRHADPRDRLEQQYQGRIPVLDDEPTQAQPVHPHPEVPQSQPRSRANVQQQRPQKESEPIQFKFPKLSYQQIFMWALLPLGAVGTVLLIFMSLKPAPVATTPTPDNPQLKNLQMSQAVQIVLGQPIQGPDGKPFHVSDPNTKLEAASSVLAWQESELVQRWANELAVAMKIGIATPGHACYQASQETCVSMLNEQNDTQRVEAQKNGDTETVLVTMMKSKALDRVATNQSQPHQYQEYLAIMAQVSYREAIAQINTFSANGSAEQLLQELAEQQQQP